jgi:RsiW-degrading membrane proteinase PrsW (M82 family)
MLALKIILSAILAFILTLLIELGLDELIKVELSMLVAVALLEELLKFLPILAFHKKIEGLDVLKYAALSAFVFAMCENMFFQASAFLDGNSFNWMRPVLASNLHIVATFLLAICWMKDRSLKGFAKGLIWAAAAHLAFNLWVINLPDHDGIALAAVNSAFILLVMFAMRKSLAVKRHFARIVS